MDNLVETIDFRRSKTPRLPPDPNADKTFLHYIDQFRRRMRVNVFMKMRPFLSYLDTRRRKEDFREFVKNLENFRCNSLGMGVHMFYKLVAEFVICPNKTHYYNPQHLFGCDNSFEGEEFRERVFSALPFLSSMITEDENDQEILNLITKIDGLSSRLDVKHIAHRTKDWFCIKAMVKYQMEKGWTDEEFLGKLRQYYRARVKKVYPEMMMVDVLRGELDTLQFNKPKTEEEKAAERAEKVRLKAEKEAEKARLKAEKEAAKAEKARLRTEKTSTEKRREEKEESWYSKWESEFNGD